VTTPANLERRRRDIFVETQRQEFQAPSGATSSAHAAPDGAFSFCELVFYKYAAPPALPIVAERHWKLARHEVSGISSEIDAS
jgi:hypothetical protein